MKLVLLFDNEENDKQDKIKKIIKNKLAWIAKESDKIVGYFYCELFGNNHEQLPKKNCFS